LYILDIFVNMLASTKECQLAACTPDTTDAANLRSKVCMNPTVAQKFTEATCLSMIAVCLSFDEAEGIGSSAPELELSAKTGMAKYCK